MRRLYVLGFLCLLGFDLLAQIGLKFAAVAALPASADLTWIERVIEQPWLYLALAGYAGAFFTWMALLRRTPIGPAFAASHLEVVAIMPLAVLLFGETISWTQIVGAAAILAGIACLARSEAG
ncbi:MAG: hypothetical protein JWR00_1163 [Rubritepida sp.]|nr:hypothetical protein [Rubritepida sp.]